MFSPLSHNSRYLTLGGQGTAAHFYHANGFPIGVYQPLLEQLQPQFQLHALPMRPTWPDAGKPPRFHGWKLYVDDLIDHIERHHSEPVIGIGHSLGASCTALAAKRRPDLFSQLVLIEPITVTRTQANLLKFLPRSLKARHKLVKSTLNKRHQWPTAEQFVEQFAQLRPFANIPKQHLSAFAQHGVRATADGQVELAFCKRWEAANYGEARHILPLLQQLPLPTVIIRGKPSPFFNQRTWQALQQTPHPRAFREDLNFGHLLPLENPTGCAALITEGLAALQ